MKRGKLFGIGLRYQSVCNEKAPASKRKSIFRPRRHRPTAMRTEPAAKSREQREHQRDAEFARMMYTA